MAPALYMVIKDPVAALEAAAKALGVQLVTDTTTLFINGVKASACVLTTMSRFKKPADINFLHISPEAAETAFRKGGRKAPVNHMKSLIDGFQLYNWILFPDHASLKDQYETMY